MPMTPSTPLPRALAHRRFANGLLLLLGALPFAGCGSGRAPDGWVARAAEQSTLVAEASTGDEVSDAADPASDAAFVPEPEQHVASPTPEPVTLADLPPDDGRQSPAVPEPRDGNLRLSAEGSFLYGPAKGFVQVPSGGRPGTTSHARPSLGEIGIDDATVLDVAGTARWDHHEFYLGGQWASLSGRDVLDRPLVTQNEAFEAGSAVRSDVSLDWYRLGYRYRFGPDDADLRPGAFSFSPGVGAALLGLHYRLAGAGSARADRSFTKGGAQVGLAAEYGLAEHLSLAADVLSSVPISDTPFIVAGRVTARYRVIESPAVRGAAFLGAAFERIAFEDNQPTPNHARVDIGPMLVVGLELSF